MVELAAEFTAMACDCEVRACASDEPLLRRAVQDAVDEVHRIERKYSRYRPDTLVALINRRAGTGQATEIDDETAALLDFAARLREASDGRFDLTSGALRHAWDFRRATLPTRDDLERAVARVGWDGLIRDGSALRLARSGMEIDFGGIGKEYAADRAAGVLHGAGVRHGYVNLGGDLSVVGPQIDGAPWRFGIRHPRRPDELLGRVDMAGGALATSGDYERCFELDGRRYCHVLDARTGWPVTHWQSISVIAPNCAAAGALCTLAMLAGAHALEFLTRQQADFLAIDQASREHRGGRWADPSAGCG